MEGLAGVADRPAAADRSHPTRGGLKRRGLRGIVSRWLRLEIGPRSGRNAGVIHTPLELRAVLDRERDRAARADAPVALVIFDGAQEVVLGRLARQLRRHSRVTDEVGWLEHGRLCAVLPSTCENGAERYAQRMASECDRPLVSLRWSVHVYPPVEEEPQRQLTARGSGSVAVLARSARRVRHEHAGRRLGDEAHATARLFCDPLPWWKRSIDIVGSLLGLVVAFPLMAIIAATIKLTSRGPVFFRQQRAGLGGEPFTIYKFRTMIAGADGHKAELRRFSEQDGPAFKMTNDPRLTRLGRLLRRMSLDELPQLWNVLIGDMSLVGPRPLPLDEDAECLPWQRQRRLVTPGLTCIWQVHGRGRVSFDEWMRMDLQYIRGRGLLRDLALMLLTVVVVISQRGAR